MALPRSVQAPLVAGMLLATSAAHADGERFDIGLRATITAADGEPANDIPGFGLLARYALLPWAYVGSRTPSPATAGNCRGSARTGDDR